MSNDDLKRSTEFLDLLNKEKVHIQEALEADKADVAELQSEWQERDSASENNLRSVEWNQYILLQEALGEIEKARVRVAEGTYGVCEDCQELIGEKRLRAVLTARMCIACQEKTEKELGISKAHPSL